MTSSRPRANALAQYQSPVGSYQKLQDTPQNTHQNSPHNAITGKDAQPLSRQEALVAVLTYFKSEIFSNISDPALVGELLKTIQRWTGRDPLLTRLVCHHVMAYSAQVEDGHEVELVNTIVQKTVLDHWETNDAGAYLRSIRDGLLSYEQRDSLLILYIQILQRGAISENYSPEQAFLLQSGLVALEGGQLKVANAIYANVFDLDWIEAQLPGITRPVMIVRSQEESAHPSALSKKYSKITVLACGLAVLVAASSMYLKEAGYLRETGDQPIERQQATTIENPDYDDIAALAERDTRSVLVEDAGSGSVSNTVAADEIITDQIIADEAITDEAITDRALFDNGISHATNGRWLPMLRDFCAISVESTYFTPAERQIGRWWSLYPEDLLVATETFVAEGKGGCPVVEVAAEGF